MTIEEMKSRKRELGYSNDRLSELTGVPKATLQKIFSGKTKAPRRETIKKLASILEVQNSYGEEHCDMVSESGAVYGNTVKTSDNPYGDKMQGEYTVEDYLALPDDKRYELIDGVIYEMASPTFVHQTIAGYLYHRIMTCVEEHTCSCYPSISPLDVQICKDKKNMVQPDVMICCDPKTITKERLFGAPAFVAEVISPSSKARDRFLKLNKYKEAGVKEYWLVDPEKEKVIVNLFYQDDDIFTYSFDDTIPVSISDGLCKICFSPVKERLAHIDN